MKQILILAFLLSGILFVSYRPQAPDADKRVNHHKTKGVILAEPVNDNHPWGEEKDGVKTRLVPLEKEYILGQPMRFRLEMINIGDSTKECDPQGVDCGDSLIIKDPDGNRVPYTMCGIQTTAWHLKVKPGERAILFDNRDIYYIHNIRKPGKYTVQFEGGYEGFSKVNLPPSNVVEIDVKDGQVAPSEIILDRLLGILPKEWKVHKLRNYLLTPTGGKEINGHVIYPPAKDTLNYVRIYHTDEQIDTGKLEHHIKDSKTKYLGQDKWGYVYIEIGPKAAAKLWPTAEADIIKVLEITK